MADIRVHLNDKVIARLPPALTGQYAARDIELKGFFVVVGKRKRTFTIQGDLREEGKRTSSVKIAIGDTGLFSTREARAVAKGYLVQISRGVHPTKSLADDVGLNAGIQKGIPEIGITLRGAWVRYRDAHMVRKERSPKTVAGYQDHVERIFKEWLDVPLRELGDDPARVAKKHDQVTQDGGPYMANCSMRTLRAIYNHARKTNRDLPSENPVGAIDWNNEKRRNSALGASDLSGWFEQLAALDNPIRREFHLFTLLSGCRPTAVKEVKPEHIDLHRRILHIPKPKGGAKRAFDIPLSREMIRCLMRAIRFGRLMYPLLARDWVFPADSVMGHVVEQKEHRGALSKWGNDLRQSYRTLATMAGVSEFDARLLMNHSIPGVNAGYITRHKLLDDHLCGQQQAISSVMMGSISNDMETSGAIQSWLRPNAFGSGVLHM